MSLSDATEEELAELEELEALYGNDSDEDLDHGNARDTDDLSALEEALGGSANGEDNGDKGNEVDKEGRKIDVKF